MQATFSSHYFGYQQLLIDSYNPSGANPWASADIWDYQVDKKMAFSLRAQEGTGTLTSSLAATGCSVTTSVPVSFGEILAINAGDSDAEIIQSLDNATTTTLTTCIRSGDSSSAAQSIYGGSGNAHAAGESFIFFDQFHPSGLSYAGQPGGYTQIGDALWSIIQTMPPPK